MQCSRFGVMSKCIFNHDVAYMECNYVLKIMYLFKCLQCNNVKYKNENSLFKYLDHNITINNNVCALVTANDEEIPD